MRLALFVCFALLLLSGCPGRNRPTGPAPEYEAPEVMPWDSGAPADPLEGVEGEEVTDDEPAPAADAAPASDAPPADGGESDSAP